MEYLLFATCFKFNVFDFLTSQNTLFRLFAVSKPLLVFFLYNKLLQKQGIAKWGTNGTPDAFHGSHQHTFFKKCTILHCIPNQWRSQPKNFGGQNGWFQANNTILFGKTPLKAQNHYIFQTCGGAMAPLAPPWLSPKPVISIFLRYLFNSQSILGSVWNFLHWNYNRLRNR